MFYLLLFVGINLYTRFVRVDEKRGKNLCISLIPIAVVLILTFSLQYDVGTDYFSYLQAATRDELGAFKLSQFVNDGEYLFALIVWISQVLRVPQLIFFLTALVQVIPFCVALYQLRKKDILVSTTLFMYFALSLSFFNQFNGIRQFAAVNLIFLAVVFLFINPKRVMPWVLLWISPLFHHAAWFMVIPITILVVVQYFYPKLVPPKKWIYICFAVCAVFYLIDVNGIITVALHRVKLLSGFKNFIGSSYMEKMTLMEIATKIIKLVVVFYAIYRLDIEKLTSFETKLLTLSYLTICVMALSFSSSIIWRMYLFFDLFLMFPVLFFYKYNASIKEKFYINIYLSAFLLVKILLLPRGEYLYTSILWR